ncbi:MAG TPA: elongation factor G [Acidobacteriota bacterium]|nr:elongation factor G [Acidobacteriota bacterium]
MKVYTTDSIRNVALTGHGDVGKTSLASAFLFNSGAVNRFGKVDQGSTVTDFDEDEIERKITISSKSCFAEWNKAKINFLDTPGYGNFIADAKGALRAVDSALVLVCGVAGVEVQTEKVWRWAEEYGLPRLLVVNKLDRERADFGRALESIQKAFGRGPVAIQIPIGSEKDFSGVIDLVHNKAYQFSKDESGKMQEMPIPDNLKEQAASQRQALMEMIAEQDDALMEKYFESGELTQEELIAGLKKGTLERKIFPVLCSSALHNIGAQPIMNAIVELLPNPAESGVTFSGENQKDHSAIQATAQESDSPAAFVFKTFVDPYAGRVNLFRVVRGVLRADHNLLNANKGTTEKITTVSALQGKTATAVQEVHAGDIASVAKLKDTQTNDTLCEPSHPVKFASIEFPHPIISYAIEPKSRGDEEKISTALHKMADEDPVLRFDRDPQTKELLVSGMGQLHVEVVVARLKRRFGVEVLLHPPKVPYRETIKAKAEVQGKYKKQSGGRGQYGDCWITMEPLPRDKDFEFVDKIFGGAIPKNYIPAVEKGIQEARQHGVLAGFPAVNFRVTVFDGSYHPVDSSEMAFKIAGSMAFKKGMEEAKPVLLEPIMHVEITAPADYMGTIMGDLNGRRGRMEGMDSSGANQIIRARVPLSEMLNYAPSLTSMTGGRGSYEMNYSHYDEVPSHLAQKIIEEHKSKVQQVKEE